MHLAYRKKNKKINISTINNNENKLLPYYQINNPNPLFQRKKSIDLILDKHHSNHNNFNDQILIYKKSVRKVPYQPLKPKKAESSNLKCIKKVQLEDSNLQNRTINRHKSTSFHEKYLSYWGNKHKKYEMEHSPYIIDNYRKTKSNAKFKSTLQGNEPTAHKDWVCQKLIENEIYSVEQSNDFS